MRVSLLRSVLALVAVACLVSACMTKVCTEAGCESTLGVTYGQAVEGSYSLALATGGLTATVSCPADSSNLQETAATGTYASVRCTSTGFVILWNAEKPLGTTAADAAEIDVQVTLTPASTKTAVHGTASAKDPSKNQPNGAECGPTCYARAASLTLAP